MPKITIGVLALQGAFSEHIQHLRKASAHLSSEGHNHTWSLIEVRNAHELTQCDALIIPGGESTTMSLVAASSGLLEPLRNYVKVKRKPTWGTCAGLILLAESANRTKIGGQELIGGLDVRVNRNHYGRQTESFTADLHLAFISGGPFHAFFIRAPIVEKVLPRLSGIQVDEARRDDTVVAPSKEADPNVAEYLTKGDVEVLATLPGKDDIIAVRQGNCFGTSFHPELTEDARIHTWWLKKVLETIDPIDTIDTIDTRETTDQK